MPFPEPNPDRTIRFRRILVGVALALVAPILSGCGGGGKPASPVRFVDGGIVVEKVPGSNDRVIDVTTPTGASQTIMAFPGEARGPVFVAMPWSAGELFDVTVRSGTRRIHVARATAPRDLPRIDVRFDPPAVTGSDGGLVLQPSPERGTVGVVVRVASPSAQPAVAIVSIRRDESMTWRFPGRFSSADTAAGLRWTATATPSRPEAELRFQIAWAGDGDKEATGAIEWTVPGGGMEPRTRRIPLRLRPPARN